MLEIQTPTAAPSRIANMADTLLAGAPDAVTSCWCLWVWIDPLAPGTDAAQE